MLKSRHILYCTALPLIVGVLCCPTALLAQSSGYINPSGMTVETRFNLPEGYERMPAAQNSYASFLRSLHMLPHRFAYNDSPLKNLSAGLLNMTTIANLWQDIQLCIRLRGEYLFRQHQYNKIIFSIITPDRFTYSEWVDGLLLVINDKMHLTKQSLSVDRYSTFIRYLSFIFTHSDISTLLTDVQPAFVNAIMPGDMFIQTAHPEYAVIVLDVAFSLTTGERIFLLAKYYSRGQNAYVLVNPEKSNGSPWYSIKAGRNEIVTPEIVFHRQDLRRFREIR
jgi:hypothetical protein